MEEGEGLVSRLGYIGYSNVFATEKKRSLVRMRIILAVFCASRPAGDAASVL